MKLDRGGTRFRRPVATGQVGDRQQRPPCLGGAVVEFSWQDGFVSSESLDVLLAPLGDALTQRVRVRAHLRPQQPLDAFTRDLALQAKRDAAVANRLGQTPGVYSPERLGREHLERRGGVVRPDATD